MKKFFLIIILFNFTIFRSTFASDLELNAQFLKILRHSSDCEVTTALTKLSAPTLLKVMSRVFESSIKDFDQRTQKKINSIVNLSNLPPTQTEYRELQILHFEALNCRRQMIDIAPLFGGEIHRIIAVQEWAWNNATKENKPIRAYFEVFSLPAAGEMVLFEEKLKLIAIEKNSLSDEIKIEANNFSKKMEILNRKLTEKIDIYLKD